MSKPKNWNEMDREQQRAWTQQDAAREDAEYTAEQNQRRAEQAERNAESARRASLAARSEYAENEEASRCAIAALDESLCEARLQRDKLLAAAKDALAQAEGWIHATFKNTAFLDAILKRLAGVRTAIKEVEDNPA